MSETSPTLPPCRVCGSRASGLHFGVITCEACKAFYKRSRARDRPFTCKGEVQGNCVVKAGKTTMCPYCRLQQCLKVGMSREGINKGRCPIEKKAELLLEARDHQMKMEKLKQQMEEQSKAMSQGEDAQPSDTGTLTCTSYSPPTSRTYSLSSPGELNNYEYKAPDFSSYNQNQNFTSAYSEDIVLPSETEPDSCPIPLEQHIEVPPERFMHDIPPGEFMNFLFNGETHPSNAVADSSTWTDENGTFEVSKLQWLLDAIIQADTETQLYDPEEAVLATSQAEMYIESRKAKQELLGPLPPLPHEVYAEIYQATGIDLDNYHSKPATCLEDMGPDIELFIEFLKRLPCFRDLCLNDRLIVVKGGYIGWSQLSTFMVHIKQPSAVPCNSKMKDAADTVWVMDDFIRYFGEESCEVLRKSYDCFHTYSLSSEELAILKAAFAYKERSRHGEITDKVLFKKHQAEIKASLNYMMTQTRGKEEAEKVKNKVLEGLDFMNEATAKFEDTVKTWPVKFPELNYPKILMEIIGQKKEEELLVAVGALSITS